MDPEPAPFTSAWWWRAVLSSFALATVLAIVTANELAGQALTFTITLAGAVLAHLVSGFIVRRYGSSSTRS